jgi:hypothetical protein
MAIRKFCVLLWFIINISSWAIPADAGTGNPMGQTLQITTRFHSITGKPVWLLVMRDADTGVVVPYMFDIRNNDNFWLAFSFGRNYIVTASTLKFGPFAVIHNFCHLENGILSAKSMIITLSGDLTPVPLTFKCHVVKFATSP